MESGGSDRRHRKGKETQLQSPTAGHPPPHMGPPPAFPPQSSSLPPAFFMPPPGPVHISVSSVGPNSGSNLNFILTPNVTSSPGFHISQQGSSSALPTSSTPAASPASSTPSVSMLNIGVSGTSTTPSIGSATPAASRGRRGKVTLQYDAYSRLIIVPNEKDG
ncbi:PREDICTED: classical arabinogalactan protein 9-like [Nicotiana attenuata]|uniref:classical arabinogalactan protein 9-like n=1 Tax=Nicotiana attenuata TaxID=49451 RepID=UPI000904D371|nr:PREDICTED: classical arabinogalactan protein 9-like [Nicotiana attenuata]